MIQLFNLNNHIIDTSKYSNLLHDGIVTKFENTISNYVGAKYAVTFNSATSALFLALLDKNTTITIPSMIPPVVLNSIITSGNKHDFIDDINWVGDSYVLHDFGDYKIVDSAQKLEKNQFKNECNPQDLMIFSFYPTKPIGGCDGGMILSGRKGSIQLNKDDSVIAGTNLLPNGNNKTPQQSSQAIDYDKMAQAMSRVQVQTNLDGVNVSRKLQTPMGIATRKI